MRKFTCLCFLLLISFSVHAQVELRRICAGGNDVTLTWYRYTDTCTGVNKIIIYAKQKASAPFKAIDSLPNGNYTEDVLAGAAATYGNSGYYFIEYELNCGTTKIVYSDTLQVDRTPPNPITPDSVSVVGGVAEIGWTPEGSPDTKGYLLYRPVKVGNGYSYQILDTIPGARSDLFSDNASADNPNLATQSYCFAVYDSCGNISTIGLPQSTILLTLSQDTCKHQVFLSWTPYTGWNAAVDSYQVFLYSNPFQPLKNPVRVGVVLGTQTKFTYQAATGANRDFYFMVRAIKRGKPYSSSSSNVALLHSLFSGDAGYLDIRRVTVIKGEVNITWSVQYPQALSYFEVTRGESNRVFDPIGKVPVSASQTYNYIDKNINPDKDLRYYQIQAYDVCGAASGVSNISNNIVLTAYNLSDGRVASWNPYAIWENGVGEYDVLRTSTDTNLASFDTAGVVAGNVQQFSDFAVIDSTSDLGFCYFVQAVEESKDAYGFKDTVFSNIYCIIGPPIIYFPNALIRQGYNKTFQPSFLYVDFTKSSYQIYDRWGQMISTGDDVRKGWDGMYKNKHVESGVFFYYYKITGLDKKEYYYKGTISVL